MNRINAKDFKDYSLFEVFEKFLYIAEKKKIMKTSQFFMNSPGGPGIFTSQGCGRCEAQGMKSWSFTANAL
ncbi:MAG: hypothetical protein GF421_08395 [Candidatus Aminicenantes bacterium]|nr:hypothetical protein [Candidatus Aminicenantes bacterium]